MLIGERSNTIVTLILISRFYDGRGRLGHESVPKLKAENFPGQLDPADWVAGVNPPTTHRYDALKRPLTRVQPDGTVTFRWFYTGWSTTLVDENNHQKVSTTDALGRVVSVQEYTGAYPSAGLLNTTTYGYDVADRLRSIRDQAGNAWGIAYDSLGRKLSLTDPDLGSWAYAYPTTPTGVNPLWLVQTQTPNNIGQNAITYQYDPLDRITSKAGPNLASVSNGYDNGTYSIGRWTSMQDGAGSATYSFDSRGRLTTLSRAIGGNSNPYKLTTSHDAQDRPLSITFPNLDVLTYQYGDHGKPVACSLNGSPLVTAATYNALLKASSLSLGNGLQTIWEYYGTGLDYQVSGAPNRWFGLPYQVQTGSLQNQTFTSYDLVGNPTGLSDADHTSESLGFAYNELDQLVSMTGSASEGYGNYLQSGSTTYDVGNLLQKGAATLSYPGGGQARPHTTTSVSTLGTFGYDANGNRQADPAGNTYAYDAENRLTSVSGAVSLQNTYDGDGARVVRVANGTTTVYVGDWYEVTGGLPTAYYPFNGQAVALKQGATLTYLHRDHLGSLVAASNSAGGEVASARYWPFGGLRTSTGTLPTDRLFTGQTRDLGDDRFYFFKARYYDATIGRFQTPDSIVPKADNPQALNRYAYGLNSPLRYADPSGHDPKDWEADWVRRFEETNRRGPTEQDWENYQFSLSHPGSGPGGSWTDADWQTFSQIQRGLGFDASRSGTFTVWTMPDLGPEDAGLLEYGPPWVIAAVIAPKPHAGTMSASLDVSPNKSGERVRISLTISPNERGFDFDPRFRLWFRRADGTLVQQEFGFEHHRSIANSRGGPDSALYWVDLQQSGGSVWGASVYANPSLEGGTFPGGEIDIGFGGWSAGPG